MLTYYYGRIATKYVGYWTFCDNLSGFKKIDHAACRKNLKSRIIRSYLVGLLFAIGCQSRENNEITLSSWVLVASSHKLAVKGAQHSGAYGTAICFAFGNHFLARDRVIRHYVKLDAICCYI